MTTQQREMIAKHFSTTPQKVRVRSNGEVIVYGGTHPKSGYQRGGIFIGYRSERGFWNRFR